MSLSTLFAGALNGLLIGGLYASMALGLSLVFGVMRFINIAHGELLILSAYLVYGFSSVMGWHPLVCMLLVMPIMFVLGYVLQLGIINPLMNKGAEPSLLTAFGLSIIAQNIFIAIWGGNSKSLPSSIGQQSIQVLGSSVPLLYIIAFVVGIGLTCGLQVFINRTPIGRAIRASSLDAQTARVMGINVNQMYALTAGIGALTATIGGTFIGLTFSFIPTTGFVWLLKGFVVVVLGGLGSVVGTLAGGLVLGLSEGVGAAFLGTGYRDMIGYVIFLAVLFFRPRGLFGKAGTE